MFLMSVCMGRIIPDWGLGGFRLQVEGYRLQAAGKLSLKSNFYPGMGCYTFCMTDTQTLDKVSLLRLAFNGLADSELAEMAELTDLRTYPPNHVLCREGAYEEIFYILAEGSAQISKKIGEGEGELILRTVGKGDLIGEMALIQNAPRAATVRTLTECRVLEMEKQDFEATLQRSPRIALDIIRITLDRLRANDRAMIAELQKSNRVLRQLDRNKMEFIQVAAHELRTPLTVLKGYANLLCASNEVKANPALVEVLDGILKGTERMHGVVNTMLDVSRIDNETLKLTPAPVLLKQLIADTLNEFAKAASKRTLQLVYVPEADQSIIQGDPTLIHKALQQLIVNAIKYTPDGGTVTVSTHTVKMEDGRPAVEVRVTDTGIGLDKEHHELVFEKFYQAGSVSIHSSGATTFKGGGPGLGLAIVRGVAQAHGGKAWVESRGHDEVNLPGCTFYLQLPI
ncbi:cyclic nucleotide-binding domain-containing protein [Chloroflexi bacterium CFX2]|nr:cyclic nucleotide-binding domain-containing protein [Chloroflexi bacterium CFX2]